MNKLPEKNRVFRLKGDLSQFKIDENGQFFVWMRHEHCWCNPFELKKENEIRTKIANGEWDYLFRWEDESFIANDMDHAFVSFLDNTWDTWYDCYLEKLGFQNIDIDAIECLKEVDQKYEEEPYYLLQQKLANNSVFQVEIWENEDGTYEGLAQEIPFSDRKSSI
ncbi:hypothetical protein [Enterococcus faecium]|uniref:hypothetical protein n=1 Tax=Enterococcus faecium TaxID=1352 RepID=UPI003390736C